MNKYEFVLHVDGTNIRVFTQSAFFNHNAVTSTLHKHYYTEIHLIKSGTLKYLIGDKHVTLNAGELLVIPEQTFHKCHPAEADTNFIAFQLDRFFPEPVIHKSIPYLFNELDKEIALATRTGMCGKIPAYLTLICSELLCNKKQTLSPIQDRQFIVHEFFSDKYNKNVSLADLADELNLSLKQTERLVETFTGNTFRKEMAQKRIQAAKHLISTENLSLAEAAEQVGYQSYSGFWKAFHRN